MRIAVTGGLGRLGRLVVERLLPGHDAVAVDRAPADPALPSVQADVRDPAALRAALSGAEVVIHIGGIDRSVAAPDPATLQTNVVGTWNAFAASRDAGARRVVLCSSTAVTGIDQSNPGMPPDYLPIDEDHALRPTDAYSVSKRAAELVAEGFAEQPTVDRVEALYGRQVPLRDAKLYASRPFASTVASGRAKRLLGWQPTTRWPDLME